MYLNGEIRGRLRTYEGVKPGHEMYLNEKEREVIKNIPNC